MRNYAVFVLALILTACNIKKLDTKQIAEQMKANELKRITESQIASFANDFAKEIAQKLQANPAAMAAIATDYAAQISQIQIETVPKSTEVKENELVEALKYAVKNKVKVEPTAQKINNGLNYVVFVPVANSAGDFFRIQFSKKEIINKINVKDLKKKVTSN